MPQQSRPIDVEEFFATARDAALISSAVAEVLAAEVAARGADPAEYVLEQGVMDAVAVDIVRTLQHPLDVADGYQVEGVIGRGGLGVVYRARQTALDRPVALKTILFSQMAQQDSVARFQREAKLVGRLRHPNIVVAFDFGRLHGRVYLVMELIDGEDLQTYIHWRGKVDEATTWSIVRQAAAGLAHAAKHGVVHRDIKPSNLLLIAAPAGTRLPSGQPMVKIADFGLARISDAPTADPRITTDGCTLGSPQYMAPEQVNGSDVDSRADIYALGATAYQMLTGELPFAGLPLGEILVRKTTQGMPRVDATREGLSRESVQLVAAMTNIDPRQRIGDYTLLLEQIDRLPPFAAPAAVVATPRGNRRDHTSTAALVDTMPIATATPDGDSTDTPPASASATAVADMETAPSHIRKKRLWIALFVVALLVTISTALLLWGNNGPRPADVDGPLYVASGRGAALFDGQRISQWRTTAGAWFADSDAEGGRVLSGRGTVRRRLPALAAGDGAAGAPPRNYQLDVAVDLQAATSVELHFGIVADDEGLQPRYVLRAATEGVSLGRRADDRAPLEVLSAAVAFPARQQDPSVPDYHLLRVERHGTFWRAYFDSQPLGGIPVAGQAELAEFRLTTEGGPVLFDALSVLELVPAAE